MSQHQSQGQPAQPGSSFQQSVESLTESFESRDTALEIFREQLESTGQRLEHATSITAKSTGPNRIEITISGMGSSYPPGLEVYHLIGDQFDLRTNYQAGLAVMAPYTQTQAFDNIAHAGTIKVTTSQGTQEIKVDV